MLLLEIEAECARLPGAVLARAAAGEARLARSRTFWTGLRRLDMPRLFRVTMAAGCL